MRVDVDKRVNRLKSELEMFIEDCISRERTKKIDGKANVEV